MFGRFCGERLALLVLALLSLLLWISSFVPFDDSLFLFKLWAKGASHEKFYAAPSKN